MTSSIPFAHQIDRTTGGGRLMNVIHTIEPSEATLLGREIDELLLRVRGLVLVRDLLVERGAARAEVDAHTDELERVRQRLASLIGGTHDPHDRALGDAA
jgi:hypothetical protein